MLEAVDLSKHFGATQALSGVSFVARGGAITAVIGPNGAGKSTTFRAVVGLLNPDSGEVLWKGRPLRDSLTQEQVGFLPEERGLYQDVRVERLLTYWAALRGVTRCEIQERANFWLQRLSLGEKRNDYVRNLSKGNQQKLQLAVCLLHNPLLLVLDEPFSGLDPLNQELVCEILEEVKGGGASVVISAHQLSLVERIADDVVILAHGRNLDHENRAIPDAQATIDRLWLVSIHTRNHVEVEQLVRALGGEVVGPMKPMKVRAKFHRASLNEFFKLMTQLSTNTSVDDIEIEKEDLHSRYVSLVASEPQRRARP